MSASAEGAMSPNGAASSSLAVATPSPSSSRRARPNFQFDLSDIEKSHPTPFASKLHTHARSPLEPVYKLPSVEIRPVTPPRFVRDPMHHDDIAGSRSYTRQLQAADCRPPRDPLKCDDIDGTRAKIHVPATVTTNRPLSLSLRSEDISKVRPVSQRHTDPLQPIYVHATQTSLTSPDVLCGRGESGRHETILIGPIDGAQPRTRPPPRQAQNLYNLRTDDISSSNADGWRWPDRPKRTTFRLPTRTDDVPGAQADSKKSDFQRKTSRHSHPVERDYPKYGLGGERVSDLAGMVHIHRHALDGSPYAHLWRPAQSKPDADAAGVSLLNVGSFTAGMQPPKPAPQRQRPRKEHQEEKESRSTKPEFGAPAEDTWPADAHTLTQPLSPSSPTPPVMPTKSSPSNKQTAVDQEESKTNASETTSAVIAPEAATTTSVVENSPHTATGDVLDPFLSLPPNTKKTRNQQKRHKKQPSQRHDILTNPNSNAKECMPIDPSRRVGQLMFGVHGPAGVSKRQYSIQAAQDTGTISRPTSPNIDTIVHTFAMTRPYSNQTATRTLAMTQLAKSMSHGGKKLSIDAMATTLNSLSGSVGLGTSRPFTSPSTTRSRMSTKQWYERRPQVGATLDGTPIDMLQRHLRKKAETMRKEEIQLVRMLG